MKKIAFLIILLLVFSSNVLATSGSIKQSSVVYCDGNYYGYHGNPKHWHRVIKKNDKWVILSSEVVNEPSCYKNKNNEKITVHLSKCIDGDTAQFIVNGEIRTTRFLAIDTPESVHPKKGVEKFGKEASKYTCDMLTSANRIVLEFDKNSDREDKYGRLLAFIYADNVMVQEALIKKGYAKVAYLYGDYAHTEKLKKLEQEARELGYGIWNNNYGDIIDRENNIKSNNEKKRTLFEQIILFLKELYYKIFNNKKSMI